MKGFPCALVLPKCTMKAMLALVSSLFVQIPRPPGMREAHPAHTQGSAMAPARAYQAVLDKDTIWHTRNLLYSPIRKPQKVPFNKYTKIVYNTEMPGTTSHIKCT